MATTSQTRSVVDASNPVRQQIERYFQFSLFAMLVTSFTALAGTGKLDALSLVLVLSAMGYRAYLLATSRSLVLSVQTTSRLTMAYVLVYVLDFYVGSRSFVSATVHLVLFIMVVKLFSVQRERDNVYLAVIAFLMILASAVLTVDSFFLATFCLFLLLTVTTSISMEMRRSLQATRSLEQMSISERAGLGSNAAEPVTRMAKSLSAAGAVLVVGIVGGAAIIFFVLPRISTSYLNRYASGDNFAAGFSEVVTLGEIGRIQQLETLVMHVQFEQGSSVPGNLKWRGISLNYFDGKRWSNRWSEGSRPMWARSDLDGRLDLHSPKIQSFIAGMQPLSPARQYPTLQYRVSMEPIGTSAFFLLPVPLYLTARGRDFAVDSSGAVFLNDPTRQVSSYNASSILLEPEKQEQESKLGEIPAKIVEDYLQLPDLDPKIAQLAGDVTKEAATVYGKAAALQNYLQNKYGYTLEMVAPPAKTDPLAFFLFTRKKGHCEYFSSAMAIMLRTQGIPSRIVNGFRNGEYNDVSGSYIVRARDAHSWVEAYIPGFGWATFDPTPAAVVGEKSSWSRVSLYVDALREFWNEWIVNYDFSHQREIGNTSISKTRLAIDSIRIWFRTRYEEMLSSARNLNRDVMRNPRGIGFRSIAALAAVLLLLNVRRLIAYLRELRLARKPANAPRAAASIWYERMRRLLRRRGIENRPTQTAQEILWTIEDARVQASVASFTEHYERARFGGSQEDAGKLPELYEEVEAATKR